MFWPDDGAGFDHVRLRRRAGALLATSELLFSLVKYAGAAYLIYLGIKTWRSQPQPVEEIREAATGKHTPWGMFRTGFLVAMSNPKAFIFLPRCSRSS